jgi:hypothetical protein
MKITAGMLLAYLAAVALLSAAGFGSGYLMCARWTHREIEAEIHARLLTYENYLVAEQRTRDELVNRHAVLIDSLLTECDVNRACWVRMAGRSTR